MISYRHHMVFSLLRPFLRLAFRLAFRYRAIPGPHLEPGSPALILANHNCAWDPFFIALSFKRAIYYVASDHIFRLGLVSGIIRYLVSPIPIVKSQIDLRTLRQVREVIKEGGIVGLFPEGNRSFSGQTGHIPAGTGKLARQLGCPVILFKIHGGYLTTPRWSRQARKGRMCGETVRVLQPDELSKRSGDEINDLIKDALAADAFHEQREGEPVAYRGRHLAEYLERVLFICPRCLGLTTLKSKGDRFACICGLEIRYNPFGFFEPVDEWSKDQAAMGTFLDSAAAWDAWQRRRLIEMAAEPGAIDWSGGHPIFTDRRERLYICERARRAIPINWGTLALFTDRLVFTGRRGDEAFWLRDMERVVVHGPQTLQFKTLGGRFLEVRTRNKRSAYKYVLLYHLLEQKRKGEPHGYFGL